MKKLKILPSILMLVLCVGILAIGVFALAPTENSITGTITISSSNPAVKISAYKYDKDGNMLETPFLPEKEVRSGININLGNDSNPYLYLWKVTSNSVTTVTIHSNVQVLNDNAFDNCSNLNFYTIDGANYLGNEQVNNMYLFNVIDSVDEFTVTDGTKFIRSNAITAKMTGFGFDGATLDVTIPSSVLAIGNCALGNGEVIFEVCINTYISNLTHWCNISIYGFAYPGRAGLYLNNQIIEDLNIPEGITEIKPSLFSSISVNSVTIPDSVIIIGDDAFSDMYATSIIFGKNVTYIGMSAFACNSINTIKLPSSLKVLSRNAFLSNGIKNIIIPQGVEVIGDSVFGSCYSLTTINYGGTKEEWANLVGEKDLGFESSVNIVCTNGTIVTE